MRFLTVVFGTHAEFLAHVTDTNPAYPNGAVFCRTRAVEAPGSTVIVEVMVPGLRQAARLRGRVISHTPEVGLWIHCDATSRPTVEYLTTLPDEHRSPGDGEPIHDPIQSRAYSRYPAGLQVRCNIMERRESDSVQGQIVDLSRGGAFVSGDKAPLVGTRVSLDIAGVRNSTSKIKVDGRVAWVGTVDGLNGFGVRFDNRRAHGATTLRTILRKASESGTLCI